MTAETERRMMPALEGGSPNEAGAAAAPAGEDVPDEIKEQMQDPGKVEEEFGDKYGDQAVRQKLAQMVQPLTVTSMFIDHPTKICIFYMASFVVFTLFVGGLGLLEIDDVRPRDYQLWAS